MHIEKIAFYGYLFEDQDKHCYAYLPQKGLNQNTIVDDEYFLDYCNDIRAENQNSNSFGILFNCEGNREFYLSAISNKSITLGDRVATGHFAWGYEISKINQLVAVGKFGMDEYFDCSGKCRLVKLDAEETNLTSAELIKKARKDYLDFRKIHPIGSVRSEDDMIRLGFDDALTIKSKYYYFKKVAHFFGFLASYLKKS